MACALPSVLMFWNRPHKALRLRSQSFVHSPKKRSHARGAWSSRRGGMHNPQSKLRAASAALAGMLGGATLASLTFALTGKNYEKTFLVGVPCGTGESALPTAIAGAGPGNELGDFLLLITRLLMRL